MNENMTTPDGADFVMALAGNKCDIDPSLVKIPQHVGAELAKKHAMIFEETSAKSGKGVQELFKKLAIKIVLSKIVAMKNTGSE